MRFLVLTHQVDDTEFELNNMDVTKAIEGATGIPSAQVCLVKIVMFNV